MPRRKLTRGYKIADRLTLKQKVLIPALFSTGFNIKESGRLAGYKNPNYLGFAMRGQAFYHAFKKKMTKHLALTHASLQDKLYLLSKAAQECFDAKDYNGMVKCIKELNLMEGHYKIPGMIDGQDADIGKVLSQLKALALERKSY